MDDVVDAEDDDSDAVGRQCGEILFTHFSKDDQFSGSCEKLTEKGTKINFPIAAMPTAANIFQVVSNLNLCLNLTSFGLAPFQSTY